jgi:hypothetical protein
MDNVPLKQSVGADSRPAARLGNGAVIRKVFAPAIWVASVPVLAVMWLMFFYAYCLRVWLGLGRLPQSIAEHAGLTGLWHHRAAWNLLGALAWVTMAWSVGVVVGAVFSRRLRRGWVLAALLVPWSVWAYLNLIDFGGWFDWFLD